MNHLRKHPQRSTACSWASEEGLKLGKQRRGGEKGLLMEDLDHQAERLGLHILGYMGLLEDFEQMKQKL